MNIKQLIVDELKKVLTDAEQSELAHGLKTFVENELELIEAGLKTFVENELESIEARIKDYVDAKFSQLSTVAATATMGKPTTESVPDSDK